MCQVVYSITDHYLPFRSFFVNFLRLEFDIFSAAKKSSSLHLSRKQDDCGQSSVTLVDAMSSDSTNQCR